MNKALGFSAAVFGLGSGIFFIGYFLFEIPSNLLLAKVGARRWIARILITWGIISGLTAFVWGEWSFYGIRFLLGVAEAGFYPGIILYLT
jgi:ACS family tartrate transporter-like MFS transporter